MTKFRHSCGDQGCYLQTRWDPENVGQAYLEKWKKWPFRYGANGEGRCSPTDLDGLLGDDGIHASQACLERHGELVIIENKHGSETLNIGQRRTLESACRKGITILLQTCSDNAADQVIRFEIWFFADGRIIKRKHDPATRLQRDEALAGWWDWANGDCNHLEVAA